MSAHPPPLALIHCKCTERNCGHEPWEDKNGKWHLNCGEPVEVVKGSKAHKEGLCNLCIYAQILASAGKGL